MSTTTDKDLSLRTSLLGEVDEALTEAHTRLATAPLTEAAHEALVVLAGAAFEAVLAWEERHGVAVSALDSPPGVGSWRAHVEELRLQAALAAMEARQVTDAAGVRASRLAATLGAAVEELARLTAACSRGEEDVVLL